MSVLAAEKFSEAWKVRTFSPNSPRRKAGLRAAIAGNPYCHPSLRYYAARMKTITIKLPDFLNASLDAAAASRKQTKSAIVRDLLMEAMHAHPAAPRKKSRPSLHERLQKYQGAGPTGVKDLASNPKHLSGYGR